MFRQRSIWPILCLLLATSLACALGGTGPQAAPPSAVTATVAAQEPTATLPAVPPIRPTLAPTDQPPAPLSTATTEPTASAEPSATATRTPKSRLPVATIRPRVTAAPLAVSYEVVAITREPGEQATLTLKVIATGGGGGYRYYHDDIAQSGALFKVAGRCGKPFVHTIKVTAANGESVLLPYHVSGLCPTPTP